MKSAKKSGQTIGILLLLQLAAGLTIPFILLMRPLAASSPGFLEAAAESSFQIRAAVFLSFFGAAFTVGLGITAFPVFRRCNQATALWFLVVCAISCVLDLVHWETVMSMLSLSQQYMNGGAANSELYQLVGAAVASARRWAHAVQLLAVGGWIFIFYSSLLRFALIPRALAALGIIGIMLQFIGVTLMMLLGNSVIGQMALPMLPIQISVAVWLIVKGFKEPLSETDSLT